jgi:hypothetical protein
VKIAGETLDFNDTVTHVKHKKLVHAFDYNGEVFLGDGDKTQSNRGGRDFWAVKINASGAKLWDKRYGGSGDDVCNEVIPTPDGGYLMVGYSESPLGGDQSQASRGGRDFWAVKIDHRGAKVWDKRFGGSGTDECNDVVATADMGYLLVGNSDSPANGDKSEPVSQTGGVDGNGSDFWVVKIDANGTKLFDKVIPGSTTHYHSVCKGVVRKYDGGYVLGGKSWSMGNPDALGRAVAIDSLGAVIWDRKIETNSTRSLTIESIAKSVTVTDGEANATQTVAEGFVLSGSFVEKIGLSPSDMLAVKIDSNGDEVWSQTYAGGGKDASLSVVSADRIIVEDSPPGFVPGVPLNEAFVRSIYDATLAPIYEAALGFTPEPPGLQYWSTSGLRTDDLLAYYYRFTDPPPGPGFSRDGDGGFLLAGYTESPAGGDVSEASRGGSDYWAVRIDANGTKLWDKRLGGSGEDICYDVFPASDKSYFLVGYSDSPASGDKTASNAGLEDIWAIRLTDSGELWSPP